MSARAVAAASRGSECHSISGGSGKGCQWVCVQPFACSTLPVAVSRKTAQPSSSQRAAPMRRSPLLSTAASKMRVPSFGAVSMTCHSLIFASPVPISASDHQSRIPVVVVRRFHPSPFRLRFKAALPPSAFRAAEGGIVAIHLAGACGRPEKGTKMFCFIRPELDSENANPARESRLVMFAGDAGFHDAIFPVREKYLRLLVKCVGLPQLCANPIASN